MAKLLIFALMSTLVSAQTYDQYLPAFDTSETDLDVFKWTNIARSDPSRIVPIMQNMLQYFSGNTYSYPGATPLTTSEGATAVTEAITFMQAQSAIAEFKWDQYLAQAAEGMAVAQGQTSETGHTAPDGSSMTTRINACGSWTGSVAENIAYGTTGGQNIVLALIIDDGVSGRGHRTNIFSTSSTIMGSHTAPNINYAQETVINYAGGFTSNSACTLKAVTTTNTPGAIVAVKVKSDSEYINVYADIDGLYLNFWSDVLWTVLVKNTWFTGTVAIVEYYTSYWKSWMYVFGFPIFLIEFWVWKWRLNDINYNQDLYKIGLEWMQDNYINNIEKMVEYHYMQYCIDWNGEDDLAMFVKTIIMVCVFFIDLFTLFTGIITLTFGFLVNLYFILVQIVIQTNDTYKQTFFSHFDLDAASSNLSATTYYYTKGQTWWNGGAGSDTS